MMLFKVGDEVRVRQPTNLFHSELGKVVSIDHVKLTYKVVFHRGNSDVYTCFDLILVKRQEETSMRFKVGDKVKVSGSWEGNSGKVGAISRTDWGVMYKYRVEFEDADPESFKEEELELVKEKAEKQSFTKSDLKTGMGVVLRDGSKGHVLLGTEAGDVIRFINEGSNQWASVDDYDENMIDCNISAMDIVEVYSSRYAYVCLTDRVFNQDCAFKREEPKSEPKPEPEPTKMTMKEINEHFGKPIEIIE